MAVIYALVDPRDSEVRYVGYTAYPERRQREHRRTADSDHTYRARWMRGLGGLGLIPLFVILEDVGEEWASREAHWIQALRGAGHRLTNHTSGGEGLVNPDDPTRARMRDSHLGQRHSEETKQRRGAALRGLKRSPESLERYREAARRRQPPSMEVREKISRTLTGRSWGKHTPEAREKMRLAALQRGPVTSEVRATLRELHLGYKPTAEAIEKTAAAHRGKKRSDDTKRRISDSNKGRVFTEEHKAHMREARARYLAGRIN